MGSAESHQAGSEPSVIYDGSVAAIVNDGSASKPFVSLGARHTVDEPSNPAVVAHSSRQATDHMVAPTTTAVCPGVVTRRSRMALNGLFCADVPLRNYSLPTTSVSVSVTIRR